MIHIDHRDFEKISGATINVVRRYSGEYTSAIKEKVDEKKKKLRLYSKESSVETLPKVDKTAIKRAKNITLEDNESHPLRLAIERSMVPKKIITEIGKSTEPIYAGGNTAANIRSVIRLENKKLNEINRKKYGRTAQGYISKKEW